MRYSRTIGSSTESSGKRVSAVEEERQLQKVRQWEEEQAMLREGSEESGLNLAGDVPCGRGRARSSSLFDEEDLPADGAEAGADRAFGAPEPEDLEEEEFLGGRGRVRSGTCMGDDLEKYLPQDDYEPTVLTQEVERAEGPLEEEAQRSATLDTE